MGTLTVTEIYTRVSRSFGDTANVQIDLTDIVRWINDAQRDIALNNQLFQAVGTTALVNNQIAYSLPADMLTLRSIKCDGNILNAMTLSEAETNLPDFDNPNTYPYGIPEAFWIWANQINLYPGPRTAVATALKIYYTRLPVSVAAGGDIPELPAQYHNRLVEYCLQQAYELDENWAAAQAKQQQYQAGVTATKDNVDWVERDFYPTVTSTEDYGFYAW